MLSAPTQNRPDLVCDRQLSQTLGKLPQLDEPIIPAQAKVAQSAMDLSKLTFIDLFAGCGGFSAGFADGFGSPSLFAPVMAIDLDAWAVKTYKLNFPSVPVIRADLSALGGSEIYALTRKFGLRSGYLDTLLSAPPCQSYSVNNRGKGNRGCADVDVRDYLFRSAIAWLRVLRPKTFVLENVLPMRTILNGAIHQELLNRLADAGYTAACFKLNAVDFGVPQFRERLFYIAIRNDIASALQSPPPATSRAVTAVQAIGDLPIRRPGEGWEPFVSRLNPADPQNVGTYVAMMRPERGALIHHHYAKPISDLAARRLRKLGPGEALDDLPEKLRPKMGFRGAYGRLHPDVPASTITGNFDYPSRGRFSHYAQDRGLTMREGARLQSFPDRFTWIAASYEGAALQIGNAVPPLLARGIATHLARLLETSSASGQTSKPAEPAAKAQLSAVSN